MLTFCFTWETNFWVPWVKVRFMAPTSTTTTSLFKMLLDALGMKKG